MQRRPSGNHYSQGGFPKLQTRIYALNLFHDVLDGPVGEAFNVLLDSLTDELFWDNADEPTLIEQFAMLVDLLQSESLDDTDPAVGDMWQNYILNRTLQSRNLFTTAAESYAVEDIDRSLLQKARADLRTLQEAHAVSLTLLQKAVMDSCADSLSVLEETWSDWGELRLSRHAEHLDASPLHGMKLRLTAAKNWGDLASDLARFIAATGAGHFGRYRAFRWDPVALSGLTGIAAPDPIRLTNLIGYDREQEAVLRNTRHFVHGAPGNNVLLYGDGGTGKSSFVKALLNEFGNQGLRLIEVAKDDLAEFPNIVRAVRGRRERFIVFVDDLSFEEQETEYKSLKAMLEGSIEARPENVLIYATSNRRHLVRENFADRSAAGSDDVHPFETMHEKISLAERFGIRVAFLAPDQERYLAIVRGLAGQEGIELAPEDLRRRALQWAQWQNGFSGRTARQFINDLIGVLAEARGQG